MIDLKKVKNKIKHLFLIVKKKDNKNFYADYGKFKFFKNLILLKILIFLLEKRLIIK